MITILYEKTLNKPMIHKGNIEKEVQEFKKILNHYLDKRKDNKITRSDIPEN